MEINPLVPYVYDFSIRMAALQSRRRLKHIPFVLRREAMKTTGRCKSIVWIVNRRIQEFSIKKKSHFLPLRLRKRDVNEKQGEKPLQKVSQKSYINTEVRKFFSFLIWGYEEIRVQPIYTEPCNIWLSTIGENEGFISLAFFCSFYARKLLSDI